MKMEKTALLLIDIQNIYFTQGPYLLYEPNKAAEQARKVLDEFRKRQLPVVHVKHEFHTDGYSESKEYLNDIQETVIPSNQEKVINKQYPNAFLNTDLLSTLQDMQIKNLVIVGMMSHMCIDTTVRACQNYGFAVTVIGDACTTKSLTWQGKMIDASTVHCAYMAGLNGMFATVVALRDFTLE